MGRCLRIALGITCVRLLAGCGRIGFETGGDTTSIGDGAVGDGDGAVGDDTGGTSSGGWMPVVPSPGTTANLFAVWASGPNNVWIGGFGGVARQFDGTSWITRSGPTQDVQTFWAASTTDLWEVGNFCEVRRWNGASWMPYAVPGCANSSYFGINGVAADDLWLVGVFGRIDHLSGTTWTTMPQGNAVDLWSVWPISTNDVYITGSRGTILHWTGTLVDESIAQNLILASVWASSPSDVWAVGTGGAIFHKVNNGAWTPVTSPTGSFLFGIWGASATDIWAVGAAATLIHYDGSQWVNVSVPVTPTTDLHTIAPVPGGGLRIVGANGTVLSHP